MTTAAATSFELTPSQKEALTIDTNCFVEAGAGSGKTAVLVKRYLAILMAQENPNPSAILAITFTEKAATEMTARIRQEIQDLDNPKYPPQWKTRCLDKLELAPINTIHGFCKTLLQQYPLEAEIAPQFSILSATQTDYLRRKSVDKALKDLAIQNPEIIGPLLQRFNRKQCMTMVYKIIEKQEILTDWLTQSTTTTSDHTPESLPEKDLLTTEAAILLANHLKACATKSIERYQSEKNALGSLDFYDLIHKTAALLSNFPHIRKQYQTTTPYIMVDEFQDTDPLQWKIISSLHDPTQGNLFLVGDLKQSIYAFRGANPYLFEDVKQTFSHKEKSQICELSDNFRTQKQLLDWINPMFQTLFAKEGSTNPTFTPLTPQRSDTSGTIEIAIGEADLEDPVLAEAHWIAKRIQTFMAEKQIPPQDIAILLRRNKDMETLHQVLNNYQIPAAILGQQTGTIHQEIIDILNLIKILHNQQDTPAWLGFLQSPLFFGLSQEGLLGLTQLCQAEAIQEKCQEWLTLPEASKSQLTPADIDALNTAAKTLPNWINKLSQKNICQTVIEILEEIQLFSLIKHHPEAKQLSQNIQSILTTITELEELEDAEFSLILETLESKITTQKLTSETTVTPSENAVQLLTIHSAKGLEFPVVFVAKCGASLFSGTSDQLLLSRKFGAGLSFKSQENGTNHIRENIKTELKQQTIEEEKRIFYVACTRARDHLILTGISNKKSKKESYLNFILSHLSIETTAQTGEFTFPGTPSSPYRCKVSSIPPSPELNTNPTHTLSSISESVVITPQTTAYQSPILKVTVSEIAEALVCTKKAKYLKQLPPSLIKKTGKGTPALTPPTPHLSAAEWGTLVHKALEFRNNNPETKQPEILALLTPYIPDDDNKNMTQDALIKVLQGYESSSLFQQRKSAITHLSEHPFSFKVQNIWIEGRIDCLIETPTGWHIIDYKTHTSPPETGSLDAMQYQNQLIFYALAWALTNNTSPVQGHLYYTHTQHTEALTLSPALLENAQKKLVPLAEHLNNQTFTPPQSDICKACPAFVLNENCPSSPELLF